MADIPLLQERYAPDQFRVLVTCVFLNRTRATIAEPYIVDFFEQYPTIESVADADPEDILRDYFRPLGKHNRAWRVVQMAQRFLEDPPRPFRLRCKIGKFDSHLSEVAHLPGIGEYASDAWRLFCRRDFYADHGIRVAEEWNRLNPRDVVLQRYIARRRREEGTRPSSGTTDALTSQLGSLQLSAPGTATSHADGIIIGNGKHKMLISRRVFESAQPMSRR